MEYAECMLTDFESARSSSTNRHPGSHDSHRLGVSPSRWTASTAVGPAPGTMSASVGGNRQVRRYLHISPFWSYSLAPVSASKGAGQTSSDLEAQVPTEVCYTKSIGSASTIDSASPRKSATSTENPQGQSELGAIDLTVCR